MAVLVAGTVWAGLIVWLLLRIFRQFRAHRAASLARPAPGAVDVPLPEIEQMLAAGDSHVVIRWRSKGTHRGPLANIPATGKSASNHGCTVMELKNEKVSRAWVYFDNAYLLRQLGVLPV